MLSLKQAAIQTGKTKPTILKQLQKGRVKGSKNLKNEWEIDASSLFKLYPAVNNETEEGQQKETVRNTELTAENMALKKEIELLKSIIDDLKADKAFLQDELKKSSTLLSDMRDKSPQKATQRDKRGFRWFRTTKT